MSVYPLRMLSGALLLCLVSATTGGCVMKEEMKRIEQVKREKARQQSSMSSNLSGEQLFIRSCNTCHPGGDAGMGPSLDLLDKHFQSDEKLTAFIRQGVGMMPGQPVDVINNDEMKNLVAYLRVLTIEVQENKIKAEKRKAERERKRREAKERKRAERQKRRHGR